jgi:hypothetical protein
MPTLEEQQAKLLEDALADMQNPQRRGLDLSRFLFGESHVAAIAEALPASQIRHLALGREELTDAAIAPLLDALPSSPQLKTLRLHTGGRIHEASLEKLAKVLPQSSLTSLELDAYHRRDSAAMCDLIQAVAHSNLREFGIGGQEFGDKEVDALIPLIRSGQITKLKLHRGNISEEGADKLFEALKGSAVTDLEFHALGYGNNLSPKSMQALADTLQEGRMTRVKLAHCRVNTEGAEMLAKGMKDSALKELVLSDNRSIGSQGLKAIADALPHTPVTLLAVDRCSDGGKGYEALFDVLPKTQVSTLQLYCSGMQHGHAAKLAEVLPLTQIRSLHMAGNAVGGAGLDEIISAAASSGLVYLGVDSTNSVSAVGESLKALLPMSGLGYLDIREENVTTAAMEHIREGVESSALARIECYGSDKDAAKQEAASACYTAAAKNQRQAYRLAYKLATQPQNMKAEEWSAAAECVGAMRFCIDQNWKVEDFTPIQHEETDALLLQAFAQAAEQGHGKAATRAIMNLLPYDKGVTTLKILGLDCKAADLLAEDGTLPNRQLCQGGVRRLFADADRWDSPEQYTKAYKSLPDNLKSQAQFYHSTHHELTGRSLAQVRGR